MQAPAQLEESLELPLSSPVLEEVEVELEELLSG